MTEQKFKQAKELNEIIQNVEVEISRINRLLKTKKIECNIYTTDNNKDSFIGNYIYEDNEALFKLLEDRKEQLSNKLLKLSEQFNNL